MVSIPLAGVIDRLRNDRRGMPPLHLRMLMLLVAAVCDRRSTLMQQGTGAHRTPLLAIELEEGLRAAFGVGGDLVQTFAAQLGDFFGGEFYVGGFAGLAAERDGSQIGAIGFDHVAVG